MKVLTTNEARVVAALGEAMFPREKGVEVSAHEADLVAYVDDYAASLPSFERGQLKALLASFDRGFGMLQFRPTQRFASASLPERRDYVERCARASNYTARMVFEGLRTVMTMAFAESPRVREAIGVVDGYQLAAARAAEAGAEAEEIR